MRRDFYPRRKSDRGHAKPEKFSAEKQNHRANQNAQDRDWQIHRSPVAAVYDRRKIPVVAGVSPAKSQTMQPGTAAATEDANFVKLSCTNWTSPARSTSPAL